MPTARKCICCNSLLEVDTKRMEKNVDCMTEYSGFQNNCLDTDVLETDYYAYQDASGPPLEDELIYEYVRFYLKNIDISNTQSFCMWVKY